MTLQEHRSRRKGGLSSWQALFLLENNVKKLVLDRLIALCYFINQHFDGAKSAAVRKALEKLMNSYTRYIYCTDHYGNPGDTPLLTEEQVETEWAELAKVFDEPIGELRQSTDGYYDDDGERVYVEVTRQSDGTYVDDQGYTYDEQGNPVK